MRDYTRKAKIKDSNEWVIGYHVYVDYLDKHYILVSEKTHDGFSGMLAMKQYEVDGDTICNPTGLTDKNGNKIWENDIVEFLGHKGIVKQECGCFGIAFIDSIDWDEIENQILPITGCDNRLYACMNDNFISLWEVMWNFNDEEDSVYTVEVIGNTFDNACIDELLKGEEG